MSTRFSTTHISEAFKAVEDVLHQSQHKPTETEFVLEVRLTNASPELKAGVYHALNLMLTSQGSAKLRWSLRVH